jgi:hypothetical protein
LSTLEKGKIKLDPRDDNRESERDKKKKKKAKWAKQETD